MPIKNIIFDLGGVIIDIEPERSLKAFQRFVKHLNGTNVYAHPLFYELETGAISTGDFRNALRAALNIPLDDATLDACLTEMLGEIPAERIRELKRMKSRYRTLLLSNTNAIHHASISGYVQRLHGAPSLDEYFHKTYYSHLVGLHKPDVRIFEMVVRENNLVPEETLYLDDTDAHLESARTLGIVTVKVTPENNLVHILKNY